MEETSSNVNSCVLQVLNDSSQNKPISTHRSFVRVHMHNDEVSVLFSNNKNCNRNSQYRQSVLARQNQNRNDIDSILTVGNINPPNPDVHNVQRSVGKFNSGINQNEKRFFGSNQRFDNNWKDRNELNGGRKFRNRHRDNRHRRTTTYTSSNYYNFASFGYNYGGSNVRGSGFRRNQENQRNIIFQTDQNIPLRNESSDKDANDDNSGCFMKMLDCFCQCVCGIFK